MLTPYFARAAAGARQLQTTPFVPTLPLIAALASLASCGTYSGGGGGSFSGNTAGAEGTVCGVPAAEGCFSAGGVASRMSCDAAGTWKKIEDCAAGSYCAPAAGGKTACVAAGGGSDTTTAGDAGAADSVAADVAVADSASAGDAAGPDSVAADSADVSGVDTAGPLCGNAICEIGETKDSCPGDCKTALPVCGDGTCHNGAGESKESCPQDCGGAAACGNGVCEVGETKETCPGDCAPSGPVCGNGTCEAGESLASCPADCKPATACGNGTCEAGESQTSCPADCKPTCLPSCDGKQCGDDGCGGSCGKCGAGTNCDAMTYTCKPTTACGNGACEAGETSSSCPADCKTSGPSCVGICDKQHSSGCWCDSACLTNNDCCPDYAAACTSTCTPKCSGKQCGPDGCGGACGTCQQGSTCGATGTCVASGPVCGNGTCESGESQTSCPADCKPAGASCAGYCGKKHPTGCYCDSACAKNGDCCGDYQTKCGGSSSTCPNGTCEAGETEQSCPQDCKSGCFGDFSLGSTFYKSNDASQLGQLCNKASAPTNCPDGYWITFHDDGTCLCMLSCAAVGKKVGQACTTDGNYVCKTIQATNASGNGGEFCVTAKWALCGP